MISRIALLICFLIGITCVTSQQATIQTQLSTNQTLSLTYQCNFPYATATDSQGIIYSSCAGNNGSQGILYTYRDNQGNMQSGWVTSPGNGSCLQSWGLTVSADGEYVFATCYGNPSTRTVMSYQKQMNGTSVYYSYMSLNTLMWVCGRDIVFDPMTEDVYAVCGTSVTSNDTRIIKFPHNETSDSYNEMAQDISIMANYIKYNNYTQNLYYATNTSIGYLMIHYPNGTSITMPSNTTVITINGTLTNWCQISSFTFSYNTSNTLFVGCIGMSIPAQGFNSYSILRIDMNQTFNMINITIPIIITNTTTNLTTIMNITSTQNITTWSYSAMNISYTDSKLDGPDGNTDLTYPADGSCKYPSAMQVDNMNQLYVACLQNAPQRSVIRYTQINATYYLPAYVTSSAIMCSHPLPNSLSIDMNNDVIVSCSGNNMGLLFTMNNTMIQSNTSSSSSTGTTGIITPASTGSTGPTSIPVGSTGTSSNPTPTSTPGSTSTTCVGILCVSSSSTGSGLPKSSTGGNNTVGNTATTIRGDITGLIVALILVVISM